MYEESYLSQCIAACIHLRAAIRFFIRLIFIAHGILLCYNFIMADENLERRIDIYQGGYFFTHLDERMTDFYETAIQTAPVLLV